MTWWPLTDDWPVDSLIGAISPVGVTRHVAGEDVIAQEVAQVKISPSYSTQAKTGTQHILLQWQKNQYPGQVIRLNKSTYLGDIRRLSLLWTELESSLKFWVLQVWWWGRDG